MKVNISVNKTYDILDYFDPEDVIEDYTVEDFKDFLVSRIYDEPDMLLDYLIIKEVEENEN